MKQKGTWSFRLDARRPPKADWRPFDARSDAEWPAAALPGPDRPPAPQQPPATRAPRVPNVRALRERLHLTQEEFATRFHLPLGTVRDWEQGAHRPDTAAQVLLTIIAKDPEAVARALES